MSPCLGATVVPASAAEVLPGGALDLTITGFARFEAFGGQQDDRALDETLSRSLDFRNDTEVHVLARAKSEETGMEYGGTIEFEADTNNTNNTDETWVFLPAAGARCGSATRTASPTTARSAARSWPAPAASTARTR